jgi:3-dehydroquinate synthase
MILNVKTRDGQYPIYFKRNGLSRVGEFFNLDRRCMVVTDSGVPKEYVETLTRECACAFVFTVPSGEESKSLENFRDILEQMLLRGFTRTDCVVAIGGGVVGDLAGFVASAFMRGVDFYNIPTTLLSQVDSSIGGKVAVNLGGWKNPIGAFYPPKGVLIDPDTLKTLPSRHLRSGLAESVKMAATCDEELFSLLEKKELLECLDEVIWRSLRIKKSVVEEDEREGGLRKILNFGHTLAHAVESESMKGESPLFHGECVALGMVPMCSPEARERVKGLLSRLGLPTQIPFPPERLIEALSHDKKMSGKDLTVIRVDKIGTYRMETLPFSQFCGEQKGWNV